MSLVSLAYSSAIRMAVISASSTDMESSSLIIISSSLYTTAAATRVPSIEPSVYISTYCLVDNGCILVISISVFPFPPVSSISYIRMVVVPMGRCQSLYSCVGSSNCLDASR